MDPGCAERGWMLPIGGERGGATCVTRPATGTCESRSSCPVSCLICHRWPEAHLAPDRDASEPLRFAVRPRERPERSALKMPLTSTFEPKDRTPSGAVGSNPAEATTV